MIVYLKCVLRLKWRYTFDNTVNHVCAVADIVLLNQLVLLYLTHRLTYFSDIFPQLPISNSEKFNVLRYS